MPSPIWLQIGPTARKDLSKGEGWNWASRLRLKAQLSVGEFSASSFLRTPLTACSSAGVKGKTWPLTLQSELWLSYRILWLQFLSQMCVIPVSLQRYMFPQTCSLSHFQSHLWPGIGPSRPRILDRKITFVGPATIHFPYTSIACSSDPAASEPLWGFPSPTPSTKGSAQPNTIQKMVKFLLLALERVSYPAIFL